MRWVSTLHLQFPFAYFKYAYTRISYHYHQGDDCDSNAVALTPQQKSYVSSLALVDNIVSAVLSSNLIEWIERASESRKRKVVEHRG